MARTDRQRPVIAVLAGGRGRRIGGAKATVPLAGRPLVDHVLGAARGSGMETVLVAKRTSELPSVVEAVVEEPDRPLHPLCGLLAALDWSAERGGERAVLAIACDMPFLSAALLRWLGEIEGPAVIRRDDGTVQPLPTRCTVAQRPELREALDAERSLRSALDTPAAHVVRERDLARFGDPARLLFGVNSRADLAVAESWLAGASRARS